ncbi:SHOCT domain-containing protein [Nocardia farcinica]
MMMWYGTGMGGWGYAAMILGTVVVWALLAAAAVVVARAVNTGGPPPPAIPPPHGPTPQQVLGERYARGEIDDEEYLRRLNILGTE